MAVVVINSVPYTGCENIVFWKVAADTADAYTVDAENVIEVPELVAVSYNVSATDTAFYANNVKKLVDTTFAPSASFTLSGDSEELEKFIFGKVADGAALKDNFGSAPEIGMFYTLNKAKGAWMIRQILKAQCSKADSSVDTKGESTSFQTSVTNVNPLFSEHFNTYVREFYSENKVFEGHTLAEVVEVLKKNPAETFETWPDEV